MSAGGSPAAFMLRWARELVVDRTVLVYSPRSTPGLAPASAPSGSLLTCPPCGKRAIASLDKFSPAFTADSRLSQGGLTYVPQVPR